MYVGLSLGESQSSFRKTVSRNPMTLNSPNEKFLAMFINLRVSFGKKICWKVHCYPWDPKTVKWSSEGSTLVLRISAKKLNNFFHSPAGHSFPEQSHRCPWFLVPRTHPLPTSSFRAAFSLNHYFCENAIAWRCSFSERSSLIWLRVESLFFFFLYRPLHDLASGHCMVDTVE